MCPTEGLAAGFELSVRRPMSRCSWLRCQGVPIFLPQLVSEGRAVGSVGYTITCPPMERRYWHLMRVPAEGSQLIHVERYRGARHNCVVDIVLRRAQLSAARTAICAVRLFPRPAACLRPQQRRRLMCVKPATFGNPGKCMVSDECSRVSQKGPAGVQVSCLHRKKTQPTLPWTKTAARCFAGHTNRAATRLMMQISPEMSCLQ